MPEASSLPNRRTSLLGTDLDGNRVLVSWSTAGQLYRCPGCGQSIEVGRAHIVVHYEGEDPYYQHWHTGCAGSRILRELRGMREVPAGKGPGPGRRRAATRARRQRRDG